MEMHIIANLGQIPIASFIVFFIFLFPDRGSVGALQKIEVFG
jgi:hypothetical protein